MEKRDLEQIKKDIDGAKDLIMHFLNRCSFDTYCTTFLFGTENQEEINKVVSYKDKKVLTPASSGDSYLGAVYYEAQEVDLFDINRLTKPVTYLKIASILTLSYEEFLRFLIPTYQENSLPTYSRFKKESEITSSFWNLQTLKKVIPSLPEDIAYFWENIMFLAKKYNYGDFVVPRAYHNYQENVFRGMPFYANEEEYYKLQSLLRKRAYPKFIETDLLQVDCVLNDSYDLLYLSNIIETLVFNEIREKSFYEGIEDFSERHFVSLLMKKIKPYLKENGFILFDYRGNMWKEESSDFLFTNRYFTVTEIPCKFHPIYHEFKHAKTDLVLTYKPSKNENILDML